MKYKVVDAIIWDYDGTLVATRSADEAAVNALIADDFTAMEGETIFWATEGLPIVTRIEQAWPGRLKEILPYFNAFVEPLRFHGIKSVIKSLHKDGYHQGVVSSRQRSLLEQGLVVSGLRPYFESVIGLNDVTNPKPDPEGLLLTLERIGVHASRALYIGDSDIDVMAGRAAQITTWHAAWSLERKNRTSFGAAYQLHTPRHVLPALMNLDEATAGYNLLASG